jgi:hypothetical protein
LTIIGWLPATVWAFASIGGHNADRRTDKIVKAVRETATSSSRYAAINAGPDPVAWSGYDTKAETASSASTRQTTSGTNTQTSFQNNPAANQPAEGRDATTRSSPSPAFEKWNVLIKYDAELATANDHVLPLGKKWIIELANEYARIGDKTQLRNIVEIIVSNATVELIQSKDSIPDKWDILIKYDNDLLDAHNKIKPWGPDRIDQLANDYLTINDKTYLKNIVHHISAEAKAEKERWDNRFSDPAYLLQLSNETIDFLMSAPCGNVAILKKGTALLERDGRISVYSDAASLRETQNDRSGWELMTDSGTRNAFIRRIAPHIPA